MSCARHSFCNAWTLLLNYLYNEAFSMKPGDRNYSWGWGSTSCNFWKTFKKCNIFYVLVSQVTTDLQPTKEWSGQHGLGVNNRS